jgi:hypothetical protein
VFVPTAPNDSNDDPSGTKTSGSKDGDIGKVCNEGTDSDTTLT